MSETAESPPPIEPTPGDFRMIYRTALEDLDRIEREAPEDMSQVVANVGTVAHSLEFWMVLGERRGLF